VSETKAYQVIRYTTAGAVVGVAAVAAVASYEHAYALVRMHGEVAAGQVPSVRTIRARLHVGQPRAQLVRAYLAARVNA
jgi:hypothetical protein